MEWDPDALRQRAEGSGVQPIGARYPELVFDRAKYYYQTEKKKAIRR